MYVIRILNYGALASFACVVLYWVRIGPMFAAMINGYVPNGVYDGLYRPVFWCMDQSGALNLHVSAYLVWWFDHFGP